MEGLQERYDIQEGIKKNINAIVPDCLVISEEFSDWEDSKRRIDLLAIDKKANLVVIEIKRDEVGAHMELQAIRYAAMVSTMSFAKACDYYQEYIDINELNINAKENILDFVELDETELIDFGKDVRIVLASAGFSKEITTSIIWLREKGIDIACVKITPYKFNDEVLINSEQIIPIQELDDYQVRFREKRMEQLTSSNKSNKDYSKYLYLGNVYNKRNLALVILTDWVKKHNPLNLDEIRTKLKGIIKIRTISLLENITDEKKCRYHLNDNDLIKLESGEIIAISNQWGTGNIGRVLDYVREDGFLVTILDG